MIKRIIIAGGGTGGHIFPAIAIANAIKKIDPQAVLLFVGANGKMEMEKIPQAGYLIEGIDIAGFNRSSLIKNVGLPYKLLKSFFQVKKIFKKFKPNAVIGVGGYASFPVVKYAQSKGIASFIHESNSYAGKSNKILGKNASKIFVANENMAQFFPAEKICITGNPVRANISAGLITRTEGVQFFGLDPAKKTILSLGGSLGAKSINEAIDQHLEAFEKNNLQLIWQTGQPFAQQGKIRAAGKNNVWVSGFITEMGYAYAAADLVISRSGAMAIAELCVQKKPAVLVPYPFAAEDHQTVNAQSLVNKNAGILVKDSDALEMLVSTVINLSNNEKMQMDLINNISRLGVKNADEIIANEIFKSIGE